MVFSSVSTGGGEFVSPFPTAGLDLLFGVLVDVLSEVHEHEDGDDGAEALLHSFENFACFHDSCVLSVGVSY